MAAHAEFDKIWKNGEMERNEAYQWLSKKMGILKEDCHIGMFTEPQCIKVIEICREFKPSNVAHPYGEKWQKEKP